MSELLHVLEPSFDRWPKSLQATRSRAILPSDLTTRIWPTPPKRIGTSRMVSHIRHNNEPTHDSNYSPLGRLHLPSWSWCWLIIGRSPCGAKRHWRIDFIYGGNMRTCLRWAAYTCHWRIDFICVWRKYENMSPCTYPFPNFNGATIEISKRSNFITYFIMGVITYPCFD